VNPRVTALALATFFVVVQFYTSLAPLAPTPPVGYVFTNRATAAALVGLLVAAGLACGLVLVRDRALLGRSPSHAILALWLLAATLSSALGLAPAFGFAVTAMMALAALFHLALVRTFGQPGVARTVLGAYLAAGVAATVAGVVMAVLRRPALLSAFNHGRAAGVFVTANQFAAFAIAFGFVALGVALAARGSLRRLAVASCLAAGAALVATVSVAGLLGAVAGGIFYSLALGVRRVAALLAVALVIAAAVLALRPAAAHDPAEEFDRLRTWQAGLRVATLFPLTGVGPMAYWRVYPTIRPPSGDPPGTFGALHPHDAYLSLAADTGLVGFAALGLGWLRFGRTIRRNLPARTARERRFVLGVCAALVAVLVQGVFDTIGIVAMTYVWIPYMALALAAAEKGLPSLERA